MDGWRGLLILAVPEIEKAQRLSATDPVIGSGETVAESHKYCGSAALMLVGDVHRKLSKKSF